MLIDASKKASEILSQLSHSCNCNLEGNQRLAAVSDVPLTIRGNMSGALQVRAPEKCAYENCASSAAYRNEVPCKRVFINVNFTICF